MSEHVTWDSMNDLVGGALSSADRMAAEAHVASCAECRLQLASLRHLARRVADAPESIAPPDDAWQAVRDRISGERSERMRGAGEAATAVAGQISPSPARRGVRRYMLTAPWLIAASLVLVAGSSAVTAFVLRRGGTATDSIIASSTVIRQASLPADIQTSERQYLETAIALRAALDEERSHLTPETVAIVERSLTVIEGAIGEAREALVRDPANRELRDLWSRNHQQKLDLLRRAAALVQKT